MVSKGSKLFSGKQKRIDAKSVNNQPSNSKLEQSAQVRYKPKQTGAVSSSKIEPKQTGAVSPSKPVVKPTLTQRMSLNHNGSLSQKATDMLRVSVIISVPFCGNSGWPLPSLPKPLCVEYIGSAEDGLGRLYARQVRAQSLLWERRAVWQWEYA